MNNKISIINVWVNKLIAAEYNPRKWDETAVANLKESIKRFGLVDPDKTPFDIREYAKHTLHYGTVPEKREIIKALGGMIYIHNQLVCSTPSR